jgi:hypothetical protein
MTLMGRAKAGSLRVQGFLEPADLHGQRRLRHVEQPGGTGEALQPRNGLSGIDLADHQKFTIPFLLAPRSS